MVTDDLWVLLRLVLALVLSGALGWEREKQQRAAGLRTHMLVGMAATLFVSLGLGHAATYPPQTGMMRGPFASDPLRLIEAVVAGISFIGAGTIFVARDNRVQGVTTAASILSTAAVGVAIAFERYGLAVATTLLVLLVLAVIRHFEPAESAAKKGEDVSSAGGEVEART